MKKSFLLFVLAVFCSFSLLAQTSPYGKVLWLDSNGTQRWDFLPPEAIQNAGWTLTGNAITASDFLGTTNAFDLIFRTNDTVRMRLWATGGLGLFNGTYYINFAVPASLTTDLTFTLPTSYGTSGQFLTTNGSGILSWGSETDPLWTNDKSGTTTITGTWTFSNTITGNISGNAGTATALQTARNFALSGDVTASAVSFNGTSNVTLNTTIANNAITSAKIADGTIVDADISNSAAIAVSKLAAGTNGQVLTTSGVTPQWTNFPGWSLTGNSGTNPSTNFIGTTDAKALQIKVNNQKSGWIDYDYPYNTAWGYQTLVNNTGIANTASGYEALYSNNTGSGNTASGAWALTANTSGIANTASGGDALYSNTTGNFNTASGSSALYSNSTGSYNVAVGYNAGYGGFGVNFNQCTFVGANSYPTTDRTNVTMLGYGISNAECTGDNQVLLGNTSVTQIRAAVGSITTYSDARFKTNVREDVHGLDFVMKLRPVTFNKDPMLLHRIWGTPDSVLKNYDFTDARSRRWIGLIAQDVEQAMKETGFEFPGLHRPQNDKDVYTLDYGDLVMPLIKSVQEQQMEIEQLRQENSKLREENAKLRQTAAKHEAQINQLQAEIETIKQQVINLGKFSQAK
ncbi:MAG: tail fiber domain-containing protein [Bacteroidota bacterium]